jgi:hypothetical protein
MTDRNRERAREWLLKGPVFIGVEDSLTALLDEVEASLKLALKLELEGLRSAIARIIREPGCEATFEDPTVELVLALRRERDEARAEVEYLEKMVDAGGVVANAKATERAEKAEAEVERLRGHMRREEPRRCHNVRGEDGPCDCAGCRNVDEILRERDEVKRQASEDVRQRNCDIIAARNLAHEARAEVDRLTVLHGLAQAAEIRQAARAEKAEAEVERLRGHMRREEPRRCHNVRGSDGPCDCAGCRDVDALLAKVEAQEKELSTLRQAVGLATTAVPTMEMDTEHPIEMMQQVVAWVEAQAKEIERLKEEYARVSGPHQWYWQDRAEKAEAEVERLRRDRDGATRERR